MHASRAGSLKYPRKETDVRTDRSPVVVESQLRAISACPERNVRAVREVQGAVGRDLFRKRPSMSVCAVGIGDRPIHTRSDGCEVVQQQMKAPLGLP